MQLLFLRQWLSDETLRALGWTFVYSLWQGLIAAVIAAIIIVCTRKASAGLRYNLLGLVMLGFLLTTGITFYNEWSQADATPISNVSSAVNATTDAYFIPVSNDPGTIVSSTTFLDEFINWFNTQADLFVMVWLLFFLVNCLKLFTGLASVHRLRNYKVQAPSEQWIAKLDQLTKALAIKKHVELLQSELVKVPVAIGFLKPVILVPMGLLTHLPPEQVETILLHELAHIRRRDYFTNIIQRFAEAVFFFNPALLWISSLIRQEREACCDDIVVANTSHQRSYLDALVSFQEYASSSPAYAMAISTKRHYLLDRVKRMITKENRKLGWMERIILLAGVIFLTAFTIISRADTVEEIKDKQVVAVQEAIEQPADEHKTRTSVLVEPVKPLKLQRRDIKNLVFQPRDTTRIKIVPVFNISSKRQDIKTLMATALNPKDTPRVKMAPVQQGTYKILEYEKSVDNKANMSKEFILAQGPGGEYYRIRKLNGEVIVLSINRKNISKNDFSEYSQLIANIERDRIANSPKTENDGKTRDDKWVPTGKQWEDAEKKAAQEWTREENEKKREQNEKERKIHERERKQEDSIRIMKKKIKQATEEKKEKSKESEHETKQEIKHENKKDADISLDTRRIELKMFDWDNTTIKDSSLSRKNLFLVDSRKRTSLFNSRKEIKLFDRKSTPSAPSYTPKEPQTKVSPDPPKQSYEPTIEKPKPKTKSKEII
jgi:beta-lactamase regulating signal transducer with metallopeptidase domain